MMRLTTPVAAIAAALVAAGCGGGASSGSDKAGATGAVAGTAATVASGTATTAEGRASFDVRFGRLRRQLANGLDQVKNGNAADKIVGAGTVLDVCGTTVTRQLGARASTPTQQERVSRLRTACADAAQAVASVKHGDTATAERLAGTALQEIDQAK